MSELQNRTAHVGGEKGKRAPDWVGSGTVAAKKSSTPEFRFGKLDETGFCGTLDKTAIGKQQKRLPLGAQERVGDPNGYRIDTNIGAGIGSGSGTGIGIGIDEGAAIGSCSHEGQGTRRDVPGTRQER